MANDAGVLKLGVATLDTLKNSPPSTDLTFNLSNAQSAIVFSFPLDRDVIRRYLSKADIHSRSDHEKDNFGTIIKCYQLASKIEKFLNNHGFDAKAIFPNFHYRDFDINGTFLSYPIISLKYLAAVSGVGSFGWSGVLGLKNFGTAFMLGGLTTSAKLEPTLPIPLEENFCDRCKICVKVCAFRMFAEKEALHVNLGKETVTYSKRNDVLRCTIVCGGYSGLDKTKKWSTWSPARYEFPQNEKETINTLAKAFRFKPNFLVDGEDGGFKKKSCLEDPDVAQYMQENPKVWRLLKSIKFSCGNCQLVCRGNQEETLQNYHLLKNSGVVIRQYNGRTKILRPDEMTNAEALHIPQKRTYKEIVTGFLIKRALTRRKRNGYSN